MHVLLTFFLTVTIAFTANGQGIEFFQGSWEDALQESKKLGKPIFVDAYAKWCGPCKRMAATTFKDKVAGEFFNKNFINLQIDAEEKEGVKWRQKYPVSAYPTLYFIDESGEKIHQAVGAQDVKGLIRLGEFALSKVDYSREFAAEYENGNRDFELIFNYVKALNKSGKSSLKISNEYLRTQDDLTKEQNLRFILEAAIEADSRIFSLLIKYQKEIGILVGLQAVKDRILLACQNTVKKSIDFQSMDLLNEAKEKMSSNFPEQSDDFAARADMGFYRAANEPKEYLKACERFSKLRAKNNDAKELHQMAEDIMIYFESDEKCMKQAEKYAKEAAGISNSAEHYYTYANILLINGKKKDALSAANKSLELAKANGDGSEKMIIQFIQQLQG